MKAFCLALMITSLTSVALAQVSPEEHAAHHPQQAAPAPSAPAPSTAAPAAPQSPSKSAADLQQTMKGMQTLMDKIEKSKEPAERERLLAQHRQAMQAQLDSMKHMDCGMGMTESAPPSKGTTGPGGMMDRGMMNGGMMKCHEMMQARMEMMVGMMEQMMRHEDAQHATH